MEPTPGPSDLLAPVRQRLVALVAAALPDVVSPPAPLRRVRDFAPARRARAGAAPILAALEDDDFRAAVARAVARAATPEPDDPASLAARAWLSRPEGWRETLAGANGQLAGDPPPNGPGPGTTPVGGDRGGDGGGDGDAPELRERLQRAERVLGDLRSENARLRHTLGEERRTTRSTLAATTRSVGEAEQARVAAEQARVVAETVAAGRDRELRQAQSLLARRGAGAGAERRAVRAERDEVTVRTRLFYARREFYKAIAGDAAADAGGRAPLEAGAAVEALRVARDEDS